MFLENVSYHVHITCSCTVFHIKGQRGQWLNFTGEKAAKPLTAAPDCVSLIDPEWIFKKTLGQFLAVFVVTAIAILSQIMIFS